MAHEAVQKLQFSSLFHAFSTPQKSTISQRLVDFMKNESKIWSQEVMHFRVIRTQGNGFLTFSRDLEKTTPPRRFVSDNHKIHAFWAHQKI